MGTINRAVMLGLSMMGFGNAAQAAIDSVKTFGKRRVADKNFVDSFRGGKKTVSAAQLKRAAKKRNNIRKRSAK